MKSALFLPLFLGITTMLTQGCSTEKESPETANYPKIPAIDSTMQSFVDAGKLSGAVTLVADDKNILHFSAVGQRDLKKHLPMRTDTIFWIASMTKPVTSAAIMMLQEDGKLSIDDPVTKFIPEFAKVKTPSGKPANLTLRNLLTHTSGLPDVTPEVLHKTRTLADLIPYFVAKPTLFEPGKSWKYSQSGINTLGRIIEITSGQSYEQFIHARILDLMGLKDTTFFPTPAQIHRLAVSYSLKDAKLKSTKIKLLPGPVGDRNHYPAANGGLFSTATDYSRFCQMLLNKGTFGGRQYLTPQSVREMTSIQTEGIPKVGFIPGSAWGLAIGIVQQSTGITEKLSPGTFGHGGAYGTQAWIDRAKDRIYLLLIQRGDLENSDASDFRIAFQQAAIQ